MNRKLDENLPRRVIPLLAGYGHDVVTVLDEGLAGCNDEIIAQSANFEGRMIVTLDRRFADIRRYPPGQHPGILVLRLRDQRSSLVEAALHAFLEQHTLEDITGCIAVVEPSLVRVRRP